MMQHPDVPSTINWTILSHEERQHFDDVSVDEWSLIWRHNIYHCSMHCTVDHPESKHLAHLRPHL